MNKKAVFAAALALCLGLAACGSKAPSQEEVEEAIRNGSVTVEDALDKGWVTQEWVDSYLDEGSVPAADKVAVNMVGEFETVTLEGDVFTNKDMGSTLFLAFLDPEDTGASDFYQALTDGLEGVRAAGADILVCSKGGMDAELFQDAPFTVVEYNDSMKSALAGNDEMASGSPCVGVWYVNGSLLSAWSMEIDGESLADSAESFVAMGQEMEQSTGEDMPAIAMG